MTDKELERLLTKCLSQKSHVRYKRKQTHDKANAKRSKMALANKY